MRGRGLAGGACRGQVTEGRVAEAALAEGRQTRLGVGEAGRQSGSHAAAMGGLKDELLKAIWHAFTALDLDHSGKVSKSQLKVGAPPPRPRASAARAPAPRVGEAGPGGQ